MNGDDYLTGFMRWALYAGDDPQKLSAVEAHQLSLMRKCQWLVTLLVTLFLCLALLQGVAPRIYGLSVGLALTLMGLGLAHLKGQRRVAQHFSMGGTYVGVLTACITNGGLGSVASAWLLYLPVVAGVLGGMPVARVWVGVVFFTFFALWGSEFLGFEAANLTRPEFQYRQDRIQQLMQGLGVVLSLLALIGKVELSEASLLKTIETLNEEVVARIEAEQLAISAEQKKSAFFASLTHELRTPLNAINGFAALLLKQIKAGGIDERSVDALNRVEANGKDLLALVNNLLSVAKSQDSEPLLHKVSYDLHQQVRDVLGDVSSLASSSVKQCNLCEGVMLIYSDRELIRRILINLLGNAFKFTEAGSVTVNCLLQENELVVSVVDTGCGISQEDQDVIFEPYTRGANNGGVQGTGLGLMLSRKWAQMLGGDIRVTSELGKGSVFEFILPAKARAH